MNREIPFFSANKINEVEDYERFQHTKAYLQQKSGPVNHFFKDNTDKIKEKAQKSGYKDFNQFREHRKEWVKLKRKIPLSYLKTTNANLDTIKYTVELDQKDYKDVLTLPLHPQYFTIRMMPSIYRSQKFPAYYTEEEAINYIKDYANKKDKICWINYPDIKTITVFPEGRVDKIYYEPEIKINSHYLIPKLSGQDIGKNFLL